MSNDLIKQEIEKAEVGNQLLRKLLDVETAGMTKVGQHLEKILQEISARNKSALGRQPGAAGPGGKRKPGSASGAAAGASPKPKKRDKNAFENLMDDTDTQRGRSTGEPDDDKKPKPKKGGGSGGKDKDEMGLLDKINDLGKKGGIGRQLTNLLPKTTGGRIAGGAAAVVAAVALEAKDIYASGESRVGGNVDIYNSAMTDATSQYTHLNFWRRAITGAAFNTIGEAYSAIAKGGQ